MLRQLLKRRRWRWAAKDYARRLGSQLSRDYGYSVHYTPDQIRASVKRAGLDARYIDLAFAAFLPEELFKQLAAPDNALAYENLNRLFTSYKPFKPTSRTENPETSPYQYSGTGS